MGRLRHINGGIRRIGRDLRGYQLADQAPYQLGVNLNAQHRHEDAHTHRIPQP